MKERMEGAPKYLEERDHHNITTGWFPIISREGGVIKISRSQRW
jgi:hypothetical protein